MHESLWRRWIEGSMWWRLADLVLFLLDWIGSIFRLQPSHYHLPDHSVHNYCLYNPRYTCTDLVARRVIHSNDLYPG